MADGSTFSSPRITQEEIDARIGARVGGGNVQGQDFASWGYNQPIGDFGTAYPKSRRKMRMEAEFEKYQTEQLQQQRMMQQMEDDQKRLELQSIQEERMQRAERSAIDAALAKESRELEIETQADRAMKSILGTTLPNGQRTRPINVNDDDAVERLQSAIASNPYGMEKQIVKETISTMLNDALDIRQRGIEAQTATRDQDVKSKVALAKDLGAYGMSIADFTENGVVNFEKANEAVGKAYAAGKTAELERAETKEQRGAISDKINSAEKELLKIRARAAAAQKRLETRPNSKDFQTEFDAAVTEQSIMEDEINRLNRALGGERQPATQAQSFDTPEQAEAAKLPKGTIVVIGGRRARID